MSKVTVTIDIDVTPQAVYDLIMDPNRLGDWVTIHRSVKVKSPDPTRQGAKMDQVLHMRGVTMTVRWTLVSVSEPREARWEGRGPAGSSAFIAYRLSGPDEGPTRFAYENDFATPGGRLGLVASRVIVGSASEREALASLQRLKKLLESSKPASH